MWLSRSECRQLTRYIRCMCRYISHALCEPHRWNAYKENYITYHREELIRYINKKTQHSSRPPTSPGNTTDTLLKTSTLNEIFKIAIATFINLFRIAHWIDDTVFATAIINLQRADQAISSSNIIPHDGLESNSLVVERNNLLDVRSDIQNYLLASGIRDSGDIWPTDDGEHFPTRNEQINNSFRETKWIGRIKNASYVVTLHQPLCGDSLTLYVNTVSKIIRDVRFSGEMCVVCRACSSMLCDAIIDQDINYSASLNIDKIIGFSLDELTIDRQPCAELCLQALRSMVENESNTFRDT